MQRLIRHQEAHSMTEWERKFLLNPHGMSIDPESSILITQAQLLSKKFPEFIGTLVSLISRDVMELIQEVLARHEGKIRVRHNQPRRWAPSAELTIKFKDTARKNIRGKKRHEVNFPIIDTDRGLRAIDTIISINDHVSAIIKRRYSFPGTNGFTFDIDSFEGMNAGIFLGEVETSKNWKQLQLPYYFLEEIDSEFLLSDRLKNTWLQENPFHNWSSKDQRFYIDMIKHQTLAKKGFVITQ